MKCFYHNDLDGHCAGAIIWRLTHKTCIDGKYSLEMIEMSYKDKVPVDRIEKDEEIIIVDFSFKPEVMEEVLKKTENIVWLDHHKTAMEYKYSKELKGIRNNEYAGCELAWQYYCRNKIMPDAVKLIGDRDKWAWKYGDRTADFCEGIELHPHQPLDEVWDKLLFGKNNVVVNMIESDGKICRKYRDNFCTTYREYAAFETEFERYNCLALNLYLLGSDAFGDKFDKYDIVIAFVFDGDGYTVGLYSAQPEVDVSKIAQKFGGGGHKGAAGFHCDVLPFKKRR